MTTFLRLLRLECGGEEAVHAPRLRQGVERLLGEVQPVRGAKKLGLLHVLLVQDRRRGVHDLSARLQVPQCLLKDLPLLRDVPLAHSI